MKNVIIAISNNIVTILTASVYGTKGYGVKIYRRGNYRRAEYLEEMPLYTDNIRIAAKRAARAARIIEWRMNVDGATDIRDAINGTFYTHAVWASIEAKH